MLTHLKRLWTEEDGQGMVEYGLILALVAVVVIGALSFLGDNVAGIFEHITDEVGDETGEDFGGDGNDDG
ncbi:Flp family type IVb pilin [Natranaerobius thermophilus]|uniref:Flp/Fap pilin component n=1 Tax=Natranaerobius thermophilus (strain ATCC BAA-1301 / DSM 18059 / JW/NM-WN-LF) TaxID=457570 RepID=B2A8K4_NATTJ|nr:Flp family type IVb pilin [Natranaerobius thermophilus]ACB85888.1 Flp/Fap pilin component [Natranaerobius thermophilus JW/NM-WN-LF]